MKTSTETLKMFTDRFPEHLGTAIIYKPGTLLLLAQCTMAQANLPSSNSLLPLLLCNLRVMIMFLTLSLRVRPLTIIYIA